MIDFLAKVDGSGAVQFLKDAHKLVLKAECDAANLTAKDVQKFTVGTLLPSKFTLRAKGAPWFRPGTKMGFNIKFANLSKPESVIGSQADWLNLQERGGTKQVAGHRLAIPTRFWKQRAEIMARSKKPGAILSRSIKSAEKMKQVVSRLSNRVGRANDRYHALFASEARARNAGNRAEAQNFRQLKLEARQKLHALDALRNRAIRRMDSRGRESSLISGSLPNTPFIANVNGREGIYVRTSPKSLPIVKLFTFVDSAPIKPLLEFEPQGEKIVLERYPVNFSGAFTRLLALDLSKG